MRGALALLCAACVSCGGPAIEGVELTWLGTTNWLVRTRSTTILLDAFFSRPRLGVEGSLPEGIADLERILEAAGVRSVDAIVIGHSHYDHAVDAGTAALTTGAPLYGTSTTCLIARAQGLPAERCHLLDHGDAIRVGDIDLRAVRTIHWWPESVGAHNELTEPPTLAEVSVAPHGGVLSLSMSFPSAGVSSTVFYQNTLGPLDGDDGSGLDYRALLSEAAVPAGQSIWLACGDCSDSPQELVDYLNILAPRVVIPHHWDGLMPSYATGVPGPFSPPQAFSEAMASQNVLPPLQYFDRFVLQGDTIVRAESSPVRDAFGLDIP